jgi:hypothetical protein
VPCVVLRHPTCGRADVPSVVDLPCVCVAAPNLPTCLALRWGAQLADMPCVAFMRPSCGRALRCVGVPNLGEAVLKSLPPRQNLFLSILQLVFWPSAPLCGCFHCRFVLRLGDHLADVPCVALGRPTCGRADVPCVCIVDVRWGAQLPDVPCVCLGAPNLRMCLSLRTCLAFALRTCVGVPNLRTCLALRWVDQLANVPCVAFGHPSCGRASRFVGAPNLGEVVLKSLPPSKNLFLSILQLVF